MKFYIAAKFTRKDEIARLYQLLEEKGHQITADWTKHMPIKPYTSNQSKAQDYAIEDMNGARNCDVFILLDDSEKSAGRFVELGAAIDSNLRIGTPSIYVLSEDLDSVFFFHPLVKRRQNINQVLDEIENA